MNELINPEPTDVTLIDGVVLTRLSKNVTSAADYGAATAQRLAALAFAQVDKIDPGNPMESQETLQAISALMKMSNEASKMGAHIRTQQVHQMAKALKTWTPTA